MKTCPNCRNQVDEALVWCTCGHKFPSPSSADEAQPGTYTALLGCLLIAAGVLTCIYYAAAFDTTVEHTISGEYVEWLHSRSPDTHERVQNIGLIGDRLAGLICGGGLTVTGASFLVMAILLNIRTQAERSADALEATGRIVAAQDAEWSRQQNRDKLQKSDAAET